MKRWDLWLLPLLAGIAFGLIALFGWNQPLFLVLNRIGPATSDLFWAHVTVVGDTLFGFALCLPLWRRRPDLVWALVWAALLATLWSRGLKELFEVARPPAVMSDLHVIGPAYRTGSFPSGHATTAFTIAGIYALGLRSRAVSSAAILVAVAVALSRPVVGVHWPLDILAGAFGGWVAAAIGIELGRKTAFFEKQVWMQWILGLLLVACAVVLVYGNAKSGYPQTLAFQRAVGLACLLFAGARLIRDLRRRPGL